MDHIGEDTIAEFKEDEDFKEEKPKKEKKEKKEKKTTEFSNSTLHGSLQAIIIQVALLTTGHRRGCSRKPWFFLPKRPADVLQNSPCFCSRHVATKPYSANGQKLITKLKIVHLVHLGSGNSRCQIFY